MSIVGPELPPHLLAKRKRQAEGEEAGVAPSPKSTQDAADPTKYNDADSAEKRRRLVGPTLPSAPLNERPLDDPTASQAADPDESSGDEDDFGPALPSVASAPRNTHEEAQRDAAPFDSADNAKAKRDEWMMLPPTADGLASRLDPTRLRPRKFNTGKGARGPNHVDNDSTVWTETPEQKRKRLEDEVMGIARPASKTGGDARSKHRTREDEDTARRIKEHDVSGLRENLTCSWY